MNEVEQMERVNLLQVEEVRELIRKRKQFEYKLQKRTKVKEDFLEYIQYESNLLKLLEIRRESTGYHHKQAEIEGSVKNRINKLFKILEHRNQSDLTIWLSHIHFLKTQGWEEAVSRLYLRILQVHNDKPGLWVESARWEFEDVGSAENARKILLRGLRFLPKSWILHREYVKLELLYVEQLKKRKDVLAGKNAAEGVDNEDNDENSDVILDCAIVKVVVQNAVDTIQDPKFIVSLISTLRIFAFTEDIVGELFGVLEEKYSDSPITWDTLAREKLKEGIVPCFDKYFQGLDKLKNHELFQMTFSTLTELPSVFPKSLVRITKNILKLLEYGRDNSLLGIGHYKFWIELLDDEKQTEKKKELIKDALVVYPSSVELWTDQLVLIQKTETKGSKEEEGKCFKPLQEQFNESVKALANNKTDTLQIWNVLLRLVDSETGWKMLSDTDSLLDRNNPELRLLHLDRASYRGIEAARKVYSRYRMEPPFNAALHRRMLEIEREESKVDLGQARSVLASLCDQFGDQDTLCWLEAAKLEIDAGKPLEAAQLLARGEATLNPEVRGKFAVLRDKMGL